MNNEEIEEYSFLRGKLITFAAQTEQSLKSFIEKEVVFLITLISLNYNTINEQVSIVRTFSRCYYNLQLGLRVGVLENKSFSRESIDNLDKMMLEVLYKDAYPQNNDTLHKSMGQIWATAQQYIIDDDDNMESFKNFLPV